MLVLSIGSLLVLVVGAANRDSYNRSDPDAIFNGFFPVWGVVLLILSCKNEPTDRRVERTFFFRLFSSGRSLRFGRIFSRMSSSSNDGAWRIFIDGIKAKNWWPWAAQKTRPNYGRIFLAQAARANTSLPHRVLPRVVPTNGNELTRAKFVREKFSIRIELRLKLRNDVNVVRSFLCCSDDNENVLYSYSWWISVQNNKRKAERSILFVSCVRGRSDGSISQRERERERCSSDEWKEKKKNNDSSTI